MRQVRNTAASGKQGGSPSGLTEMMMLPSHVPPQVFPPHRVSHRTEPFLRVNAAINRLTRSRYKRQTNSAG